MLGRNEDYTRKKKCRGEISSIYGLEIEETGLINKQTNPAGMIHSNIGSEKNTHIKIADNFTECKGNTGTVSKIIMIFEGAIIFPQFLSFPQLCETCGKLKHST